MDIILTLPQTKRNKDAILVVVDQFLNMANFIPCNKTTDTAHVVDLYFKEVIKLLGILSSIDLDHNTKLLGHFWETLCKSWVLSSSKVPLATSK